MRALNAFLATSFLVAAAGAGASCIDPPEILIKPGFSNGGHASSSHAATTGAGGVGGSIVPPPMCTGLECKQAPFFECKDPNVKTTVSGYVYTPAGNLPLYNAVVYVPNAPLDDVKTGASCEKCATLSGSPIATALTDATGHFVLDNVPWGDDIPIVVQVGKFRRMTKLPKVPSCVETKLTDPEQTRLAKNQQEGSLPQMAIATGDADPFECLLRKIGIDDAEVTLPTGPGRVHFYKGEGGVDRADPNPTPDVSALWSQLATLKQYDIVFLPCEGASYDDKKPADARTNVVDYVNLGGRLFTTHYQYTWLEGGQGVSTLSSVANWDHQEGDRADKLGLGSPGPLLDEDIQTSFPKGKAFADWLLNVSASTTYSKLPVKEWRHDVASTNYPPSTAWIDADTTHAWKDNGLSPPAEAGPTVGHFTFNTPIEVSEKDKCGKVVFSDFHVSASERDLTQMPPTFPTECKNDALSPQEKALIFMLFDLSACIQNENEPPSPK